MSLFNSCSNENIPKPKLKIGQTDIEYVNSASILTECKGFLDAYDYSLNPYSGCALGCNYCYAAFFTRKDWEKENWGKWLKIKQNALWLLMKWRKKPLRHKTIYMSSVTDPYQPIEKSVALTRNLLQELLTYHQPRLVIQTRSPLITRDIDLLQQFENVQVNMTITTDSETVRKAFEPFCPSIKLRLQAIQTLTEIGIPTCITMTPLLPIENPEKFAQTLLETGVQKFVVQYFQFSKGKFVASTREKAFELIQRMNWKYSKYEEVIKIFREKLPCVEEGKAGFAPA